MTACSVGSSLTPFVYQTVGYPFTWPNDWSRCNVLLSSAFTLTLKCLMLDFCVVSDCSFSAQCFAFPAPNSLVEYKPNNPIVFALIFCFWIFYRVKQGAYFRLDQYFQEPCLLLSRFFHPPIIIKICERSGFLFSILTHFAVLNFSVISTHCFWITLRFDFLLLGKTTIIGRNVGDIYLKK